MPVAVSDSSTLIHLSAIGRLSVLFDYYEMILIPPAVWREVVEEGQGLPGAGEVQVAAAKGQIEVVAPSDLELVRRLASELHRGEAEAIALATQGVGDVVLLDDGDARGVAQTMGLRKTGAVGILIRARLEGKLESLADELRRLRHDAGFRMSDRLSADALAAVGEGPSERT